MIARIFVAVSVLVASPAYATCTWSSPGPHTAKVVCTTGNESAPTLATEGMPLINVSAVAVVAAADSGQTLSGAGALHVYVYDPGVGAWARCQDCGEPAVTLSSVRYQAFAPFQALVKRGGRIALVPVGVTVSSGGVTIYLTGEPVAK
jgi:hypothetical protein